MIFQTERIIVKIFIELSENTFWDPKLLNCTLVQKTVASSCVKSNQTKLKQRENALNEPICYLIL